MSELAAKAALLSRVLGVVPTDRVGGHIYIYISASQREVNHGAMEFTRGSKQRTHGTQCIDRMWRSLKNFMPRGLNSKARHALNDSVKTYVWAFVCRTHVRGHKLLHSLGALAKAKNDD